MSSNSFSLLHLQLLLMKRGGQVIYAGPLGHHSHKLIEYFEVSIEAFLYLSSYLNFITRVLWVAYNEF